MRTTAAPALTALTALTALAATTASLATALTTILTTMLASPHEAVADPMEPLTLAIVQDLAFGVVAPAAGGGVSGAVLDPTTSALTPFGGATPLGGRPTALTARLTGGPGCRFEILPPGVVWVNAATRISRFTVDAPLTLDAYGEAEIRIGARLILVEAADPGPQRGGVTITARYPPDSAQPAACRLRQD